MDTINEDIIFHLLDFIDEKDQFKFIQVNKYFNKIVKDGYNIKKLFNIKFPYFVEYSKSAVLRNIGNTIDPYKAYSELYKTQNNFIKSNVKDYGLSKHFGRVGCVDFDDNKIITGSADSSINIYDTKSGNHLKIIKGHTLGVRVLTFDKELLFTGSYDRSINIWDSNTLKPKDVLIGHTSSVSSIVRSKYQSNIIYSSGHDGAWNIWDINTGIINVRFQAHDGWISSINQYDANIIFTGGGDEMFKIWDTRHNKCIRNYDMEFYIRTICVKNNSIYIGGKNITNIDVRNIGRHNIYNYNDDRVLSMDINDQFLSAGMQSGVIKLYDFKSNKFVEKDLNGHTDMVMGIKLDDEKIVSVSADNSVRIWNFHKYDKYENKYQNVEYIDVVEDFNKIAIRRNFIRKIDGIYHRPGTITTVPEEWVQPIKNLNTHVMNTYLPRSIVLDNGKKQRIK
jgi:WD40 repeat protein